VKRRRRRRSCTWRRRWTGRSGSSDQEVAKLYFFAVGGNWKPTNLTAVFTLWTSVYRHLMVLC